MSKSKAMVLLTLLGSIAAAFPLNSLSAKHAANRSSGCHQALAIMEAAASELSDPTDRLLNSAPAFPKIATEANGNAPELVRLTPTSSWWRGNWEGVRPSSDLIRRWFAAPFKSIAVCRHSSDAQTIDDFLGWRARVRTTKKAGGYNVEATYPVVDASGSYALMEYSTIASDWMVGGRTILVLLKRTGSKWRKVGAGFVSVS